MIVSRDGKRPSIHESVYVAPNATVCGDVTIGKGSRVMFGSSSTSTRHSVDAALIAVVQCRANMDIGDVVACENAGGGHRNVS